MDINNMLKDPNGTLPDDSYVEEAKFRALVCVTCFNLYFSEKII